MPDKLMYMLAGPRLKLVQTQRVLNIFVDMFSYLRFRLKSMSFDCASFHNSPFIQAGITREAKCNIRIKLRKEAII